MLIECLKADKRLQDHFCQKCEENGFSVTINPKLRAEDYLIIKVDSYYNNQHLTHTPPSPDCLVIVRCRDGSFVIYIVELRDISSPQGFTIKNIRDKFETCLNDFMSGVLRQCFLTDTIRLERIRLLFVTDPYQRRGMSVSEKPGKPTRIDFLLAANTKPLRYDRFRLGIEHSSVNPTIDSC